MNEADHEYSPEMEQLLVDMDAVFDAHGDDEPAAIGVLEAFVARNSDDWETRWARLQLARGYEIRSYRDAAPDDLARAYEAYVALEGEAEEVGTEVLLGAARIHMQWDRAQYADEIERLCLKAFDVYPNPQARYLLADLREHLGKDLEAARVLYAEAAAMGLVVALHEQARIEWALHRT